MLHVAVAVQRKHVDESDGTIQASASRSPSQARVPWTHALSVTAYCSLQALAHRVAQKETHRLSAGSAFSTPRDLAEGPASRFV